MSEKKKRGVGPLLILLAGCFWSSMGIFVRKLGEYGFSPVQIAAIRLTLAAVGFSIILLIKDRKGFKIHLKDLPLFLGLGFGSILFFTVCYFTAIRMMPLSTAAILLYTSPIWIMLMSVLFFREKLTGKKLLALGLAFAGCVLVSGISGEGITVTGLLIGLGSGIGYGLYSILGTHSGHGGAEKVLPLHGDGLHLSAGGGRVLAGLRGRRHDRAFCCGGEPGIPAALLLPDGPGDGGDPLPVLHAGPAPGGGQPGGHPGDGGTAGGRAGGRAGVRGAADADGGHRDRADPGGSGNNK